MRKLFTLREMRRFILIFYAVGLAGFLIPWTHDLFQKLIPLAVLVNVYLLMVNHEDMRRRDILIFITIFIAGFFIEVLGVNTGFPFGDYRYGKIMGPQIMKTPLIIGFNWLMLTYCAYYLMNFLPVKSYFKPFVGGFFMLAYDFLLEPMALTLGMWNWDQKAVPLTNYISWYIFSCVFISLLAIAGTRIRNGIALHVISLQTGLFAIMLLFSYIFKI